MRICQGVLQRHASFGPFQPFTQRLTVYDCDKITPGTLMAALRINIPVIFVSGGLTSRTAPRAALVVSAA